MSVPLANFFSGHCSLGLRQWLDWPEVVIGWETANRYTVVADDDRRIGVLAEYAGGVVGTLKRQLFGRYRPLDVRLADSTGNVLVSLTRGHYFFTQALSVETDRGRRLGTVSQRTDRAHRKHYDLLDADGKIVARVDCSDVLSGRCIVSLESGGGTASITRSKVTGDWALLTNADVYRIEFAKGFEDATVRALAFSALLSIDLDYFEVRLFDML